MVIVWAAQVAVGVPEVLMPLVVIATEIAVALQRVAPVAARAQAQVAVAAEATAVPAHSAL